MTQSHRPSQEFVLGPDNRGAKIETPKTSKGEGFMGMGRGCPLPADQRLWGSVVSSPSGVRGGAPAENEV